MRIRQVPLSASQNKNLLDKSKTADVLESQYTEKRFRNA